MRKLALVAGLAAAALVPSWASAQSSCEQPRDSRGAGGAIVGSQMSTPDAECAHGDYPSGRWVSAQSFGAGGYTDARGRWIPSTANGHYDDRGAWVITASGYYDERSRWIAGQTTGAYDGEGRWTPGARSGHVDGNGIWVADAQLGYYDGEHRWRAGPANGYYDAGGRWIAMAPSARGDASDANAASDRNPAAMPRDLYTRLAWLDQHIHAAGAQGALSRREVRRDLGELDAIRRRDRNMRDSDGQLSRRDEVYLHERLDRLGASLRLSLNESRG